MIEEEFYKAANSDNAEAMSKYMRNLFPFLGIRTPLRRELEKKILQEKIKEKVVDWNFIFLYLGKSEREFHYLAVDYLAKAAKYLTPEDIENLEKMILTKSWWDSVDNIAPSVGVLLKNYPELKNTFIERCIFHENFWMRRIGIIFQLKYKENTDCRVLERSILLNLGSDEFFINKSIGWALREYSKTDKNWVKNFIQENQDRLSPLSIREGSKYLQ